MGGCGINISTCDKIGWHFPECELWVFLHSPTFNFFIMGKISEAIHFINMEKYPSKQDKLHYFFYLTIGEDAKKVRKEYRKALKLKDIEENEETLAF